MKQKYTNSKILGKITAEHQTTREIANKLSFIDKKGKTWTPSTGTIRVKLNLLCQAGLVNKKSTPNHVVWYKPPR